MSAAARAERTRIAAGLLGVPEGQVRAQYLAMPRAERESLMGNVEWLRGYEATENPTC